MKNKKHIVVLSGAGISAESGLKTFRDSDGLWNGYDVYEVASPQGWTKNPQLVLDFYNDRRRDVAAAGYFPVGDCGALARIIDRAADNRAFYEQLQNQCAARMDLFSPEREKNAVLQLVDNCGQHSSGRVGTLPRQST